MNTDIIKFNQPDIDIYDIVTSPYIDINGNHKVGLFLVVYTESKDPNDYNHKNVTGLKITSRDLYANMYRVPVTQMDVPELRSDSYIYTNKPSTLLIANCRFVAKLPVKLSELVRDKLNVYLAQISNQTTDSLILKLKGGE